MTIPISLHRCLTNAAAGPVRCLTGAAAGPVRCLTGAAAGPVKSRLLKPKSIPNSSQNSVQYGQIPTGNWSAPFYPPVTTSLGGPAYAVQGWPGQGPQLLNHIIDAE